MEQDNFQRNLLKHTEDFRKVLATPSGDWSVKGFIDIGPYLTFVRQEEKLKKLFIGLIKRQASCIMYIAGPICKWICRLKFKKSSAQQMVAKR